MVLAASGTVGCKGNPTLPGAATAAPTPLPAPATGMAESVASGDADRDASRELAADADVTEAADEPFPGLLDWLAKEAPVEARPSAPTAA